MYRLAEVTPADGYEMLTQSSWPVFSLPMAVPDNSTPNVLFYAAQGSTTTGTSTVYYYDVVCTVLNAQTLVLPSTGGAPWAWLAGLSALMVALAVVCTVKVRGSKLCGAYTARVYAGGDLRRANAPPRPLSKE